MFCSFLYMTQILQNNIFISEQILQKSESKVRSEFVHPKTDSTDNRSTIYRCFKLLLAYIAYLLPFAVTGFALISAGPPESLQTICTQMKAPFLLNNSIPTEVNMKKMFKKRRKSDRTSCAMYGAAQMGPNIQRGKTDL